MVAILEVPSTLFTFVRSAGFTAVFPTVRVMSAVAGVPALSVTRITRFSFAPAAVGVPETVPSEATCSQAGPETLEKVYGAVPPVAPIATEKEVIATPLCVLPIFHVSFFANASGVPAGAVTVYSGEPAYKYEKVSATKGVSVVHATPSTVTVTPALSSTCVKPAAPSMRT